MPEQLQRNIRTKAPCISIKFANPDSFLKSCRFLPLPRTCESIILANLSSSQTCMCASCRIPIHAALLAADPVPSCFYKIHEYLTCVVCWRHSCRLQVATLHTDMIKWMVQLLLRLSPDRPDHSIEARDSIHLGSATAAQIEESGHELFERLRFFTQNLFGCVLRRILRHRVMNALVQLYAHSLQTLMLLSFL